MTSPTDYAALIERLQEYADRYESGGPLDPFRMMIQDAADAIRARRLP